MILFLVSALGGALILFVTVFVRTYQSLRAKTRGLDIAGAHEYLRILTERGYHDAYFIFNVRGTPQFVQFRKQVSDGGAIHLMLYFPKAPWSEAIYQPVDLLLRRLQVPNKREAPGEEPVREFLVTDFGANLHAAASAIET